MNTRFLIPVTVATALHALVLLNSERSSRPSPTKPPVEKTILQRVFFSPKDEPEEVAAAAEPEESRVKGNPDALRPTSVEPPPSPRLNDFEIKAVELPPSAGVTKIMPGVYGDPEGTGESWTARAILTLEMLDNTPRTRAQAAPIYPSEARRQGLVGEVLVEFTVDESGRVLNPRVVRSSHTMFESATLSAVAKWRFEPGRKDGRAVRFRMVAPIVFGVDV